MTRIVQSLAQFTSMFQTKKAGGTGIEGPTRE